MILRAETDVQLLAEIGEVLADTAIDLDTRAMLAALLIRRDLVFCPYKSDLKILLGRGRGVRIGPQRLNRMMRSAESAGYIARPANQIIPRVRRRPIYTFIVGSKARIDSARADGLAR